MASSNSTSKGRYDVFLSFRGADTRKGFTDHLFSALVRDGIRTFRDDNEINSGEEIGPECLQAIEESRFSIVILSKGYASSTWCLDELVHILKCRKGGGHVVWPVFYDVDPSDVEELKGSFKEAFAEHEKSFKDDMDKVQKWRDALREVAYLKGLDLQNHLDGHEAKNIDYIVKEISVRLDQTILSVATHPVGLHSRAEGVISLLYDEPMDVGVVGIYGMGGIGKTTLAKEVYNLVVKRYEGSCFLENVRQQIISKGTAYLQRQLLSEILKRKHEKIDNVDRGLNVIRDRLYGKRVLIVLDDIDKLEELNKFLGKFDWLFPGSRVIITTRTKDLLQPSKFYRQYEVGELDEHDSLQLLSLHAFNEHHPIENYMDCARRVVSYSGGIPLALEVLGSSLHGQTINVWNSRLEKLKVIGNGDIHNKLKISYDSLDDSEKFIFLDIACFFIGYNKDYIMSILEECGFFPVDGINTLMRRCLVKVGSNNKLSMHDLLRDMGREIVRRESSTDPGERSRLWRQEDVIDVLTDLTSTKAVEGLILNLPGLKHSFSTKAFKKMKKLRLLQLNFTSLTGSYEYISTKLRWLCWLEFPLKSIPSDLDLGNLIALDMRYSSLQQFSMEIKSLKKLKFLNLSHSLELTKTPNFEAFPCLEKLILKDCVSLVEVHDSIGLLSRLLFLNFQDCKSLKTLPGSICALSSLEKLNVSGCLELEELPELGSLKSLAVLLADGTAISTLPETIGNLEKLKILSLCKCHLIFSPKKCLQTINVLPASLRELDLSHCNLSDNMIPNDLQGLFLLQTLKLCGNNFTSLPASIGSLPKLETLWLNKCKRLEYIPELQSSLMSLEAQGCPWLQSINLNFWRGRDLKLYGCQNLKCVEGFFNLEPLGVEIVEKILGTCGLDAEKSFPRAEVRMINNLTRTATSSPLQALCERSIYSIFLPVKDIPTWFSHQNEGDTVSLQVPALDSDCKITGFFISAVYAWQDSSESCYLSPNISVINRTKNFHWMFSPRVTFFPCEVEQDMMWLSCWLFENEIEDIDEIIDMSWRFRDEMEAGDQLDVWMDMGFGIVVKKCGIHLLYYQNDLQGSQSNAILAAISHACFSRHHERFVTSSYLWLAFNRNCHEVTISRRSCDAERFQRWSKKRAQRVEKQCILENKYCNCCAMLRCTKDVRLSRKWEVDPQ